MPISPPKKKGLPVLVTVSGSVWPATHTATTTDDSDRGTRDEGDSGSYPKVSTYLPSYTALTDGWSTVTDDDNQTGDQPRTSEGLSWAPEVSTPPHLSAATANDDADKHHHHHHYHHHNNDDDGHPDETPSC